MLQSIENGQRMGRVSLADLAGWESAFRGLGNQEGINQAPPTMSLRDMVSQPEQQGNFMRNNTTGAVVNFDSQPQGQGQGQLPDYAQPIEIAGYGKGYRSKTDPFAVILNDGRTVQTNVDRDAMMARQRQALDMESRQLGNQLTLAQIAAAGRREAPTYQHVETPNGMMVFNPRDGSLRQATGMGGQPIQGKQAQPSEDERKAAGYAIRMDSALKTADQIAKEDPSAVKPGLMEKAAGLISEPLANVVRSENRQRIDTANLDALDAALTLATGAAYTKEQLAGLAKSYFPQIGDEDKTIEDKKARLNEIVQTAKLRAGRMNPQIDALRARQGSASVTTAQGGPAASPKVGSIEDGHVFMGGDPKNPASWKKVQ